MQKILRLKYCYDAHVLDDKTVLLKSEKEDVLLSGKLVVEVLSQLKEGISADQLILNLDGKWSLFEISHILAELKMQGYITQTDEAMPSETYSYWNSLGMDIQTLKQVLQDKPVAIETTGLQILDVFFLSFATIGINIGTDAALKIVVTDDYENTELQKINRHALSAMLPWMLVKPTGTEFLIGPIFLPGKTGCWECLRQRLSNNRPMNVFYKHQKNTVESPTYPATAIPLSVQMAANQSALEIVKWLYFGYNKNVEGTVVSYDTAAFATQSHVLVKRPQCPVCGEEDRGKRPHPNALTLQRKSAKCVESRGGYREVPAEKTYEKYKHHVSPITGVVPILKPYYPIDGAPVYSYYSGKNMALQSKTLFWLNYHMRGSNGGKGADWAQAKTSALCEAIERYSCTYQGDEYAITANYNQLAADAIHPNTCMNFSEKQYREREETNRRCSRFYLLVPRPFDPNLEMEWAPVYSLTEEKFKYVPSCFCYAQYPGEDENHLFSYPDSNGTAAGNSIEEAILQGFLELVERDSVALWWYNMLKKPAVDLTSFNEPYFIRVSEYYKQLNRDLVVLDLTGDLHIPAFVAISPRNDGGREEIIFGFGAHLHAGLAIERALVELNQILPTVNVPQAGVRADAASGRTEAKYRTKDKIFIDWLNTATVTNQPFLAPDENAPMKKASDYPRLCEPTIYDSLDFCIQTAARQGLETLVSDMTRPDIRLNVAKVIVPGLRHFWKRLAPGRLYDVPVKMGWLKTSLKEENMNPTGLFI